MTYRLITAPTFEPISVAEAKLHCRIDGSDEDALVADLIKSAREAAEHETGRRFVRQTWEATFDGFASALRLWPSQVLAVVSVNYVDLNGVLQAVSATDYALDNAGFPAWLKPAYGLEWPATLDVMNAVNVRYRVGYIDTGSGVGGIPTEAEAQAAVPATLKQWMKIQVATLYDQARSSHVVGTVVSEVPGRVIERLLDPHRTYVE